MLVFIFSSAFCLYVRYLLARLVQWLGDRLLLGVVGLITARDKYLQAVIPGLAVVVVPVLAVCVYEFQSQ